MGNKEICLWFLTCVEAVMGDKVDSLRRAYDVLCGFAMVHGVRDSQRATRQWMSMKTTTRCKCAALQTNK